MKNNLAEQFKQLKNITPSNSWKENLGHLLNVQAEQIFPLQPKFNFSWNLEKILLPFAYAKKFAILIIVLAVAIGGSVFTLQSAKQSLPGNFLYNVKIAQEKTQMALTTSAQGKLKLKLNFADNRLQEVNQLINENSAQAVIGATMDNFQKEIQGAEECLAQSNISNETAKEMAQSVNNYQNILTEIQTKSTEKEVSVKVAAAVASSQKLNKSLQSDPAKDNKTIQTNPEQCVDLNQKTNETSLNVVKETPAEKKTDSGNFKTDLARTKDEFKGLMTREK